MDFHEIKDKSM